MDDYFAIGNNELKELPELKKGDSVICNHCGKPHNIKYGVDTKTGKESTMLAFVNCGDKSFLVGLNGKRLSFVKPSKP